MLNKARGLMLTAFNLELCCCLLLLKSYYQSVVLARQRLAALKRYKNIIIMTKANLWRSKIFIGYHFQTKVSKKLRLMLSLDNWLTRVKTVVGKAQALHRLIMVIWLYFDNKGQKKRERKTKTNLHKKYTYMRLFT